MAKVPTLVYASSVGAYARGPKDRRVDETWPTSGIPQSFYSRHKAEVERRLDVFERETPTMRVVRVRPALVFKREAASGVRRLFLGPLVPSRYLRALLKVVPDVKGLRVQAIHADDLADLYRRAILADVAGAFNAAAEPPIDAGTVAGRLGSLRLPVRRSIARGVVDLTWRAHLQPTSGGWIDLGLGVPLMSSSRASAELGWRPATGAVDAFVELVDGMRDSAGTATPPLDPGSSGPVRMRELATGVGSRDAANT
jgi:nucleoside-diphosphate-sugar epimerase